jgi:hypothetical protein
MSKRESSFRRVSSRNFPVMDETATTPRSRTTGQGRGPARLLVACAAAATLVGCAGAAESTGAAGTDVLTTGSRTVVQPESHGDALAPLGQPTTGPVESDGFPAGGLPTQLTDVRAAGHETFDRVVLEFAGPAPEYRVAYVEPPVREQGSGRAVDVVGAAFLQITASPASGVQLEGEELRETYGGPGRLDPPYADVITEVVSTGDYEATLTWVIGLERRVPYGVVVLDDPTRLVVDVRHHGSPEGDAGIPPVGSGGTNDTAAEGSGRPVVLTDVRLGAHDGFDRIVFEFDGGGEPGYRVGYVDDPAGQGSGEPIEVPGAAALRITLTQILLPPDAPAGVEPWQQTDRLAIRDAQVVEALIADSLLEGRFVFHAGVTDRQPFAVERFDDPQRLVIDVLTDRSEALGESCTSPAGFTVGHPSDWSVNSGETVPACSRFAPSEFSLPDASDVRIAATALSIQPVPFERVTQGRPGEVSRERLTVDGRDAVRIERETQEGLYPMGTPITTYAVRLADGDTGPRTLVADTIGLQGFQYQRNVEVLDAQIASLDIEN